MSDESLININRGWPSTHNVNINIRVMALMDRGHKALKGIDS